MPGASGSLNKAQSLGVFLQDKWKIGNNLTLTVGLRYDLEVIPFPEIDNPMFESPDDYPVDTNNFQPRLGLAYNLGGATVLRGGYGRFFDKTHFEIVNGVFTNTPFTTSFNRNFPLNKRTLVPSRDSCRPIRSSSTVR